MRERDLSNFTFQAHRLLWGAIRLAERQQLGEAIDDADQLDAFKTALIELDLLRPLRESITDIPPEATPMVMRILYLDEKTRIDIARAPIIIRAAAATLERINSEKRYRHLLDAWQRQPVQTIEFCIGQLLEQGLAEGEDADEQIERLYLHLNEEVLQFQKLFYDEWRYLEVLDGQRRADPLEILSTPLGMVDVEG